MSHKQLFDNAKPSGSADANIERNMFDLSKKHFATYGLGKIYPMYTRLLQPNETIKITPTVKLDLEPMAHEIRNRLTAHIMFASVPVRALWKDYNAFIQTNDITKSSEYIMPYLSRSTSPVTVGSLLNHMGAPAVAHVNGVEWLDMQIWDIHNDDSFLNFSPALVPGTFDVTNQYDYQADSKSGLRTLSPIWLDSAFTTNPLSFFRTHDNIQSVMRFANHRKQAMLNQTSLNTSYGLVWCAVNGYTGKMAYAGSGTTKEDCNFSVARGYLTSDVTAQRTIFGIYVGHTFESARLVHIMDDNHGYYQVETSHTFSLVDKNGRSATAQYRNHYHKFDKDAVDAINEATSNGLKVYILGHILGKTSVPTTAAIQKYALLNNPPLTPVVKVDDKSFAFAPGVIGYQVKTQYDGLKYDTSVFNGSNVAMRLNALRPRAYRAIYNSYFRDKVNDPFCPAVNPHDPSTSTTPYVDRIVENMDSGADTDTPLDFEYCYWDEDYYNGSLVTPSMLNCKPLVGARKLEGGRLAELDYSRLEGGVSSQGKITLTMDGDVLTGIQRVEGDVDKLQLETLQDAIQIGISYDDIRLAQTLTKWLETNYKHGRFSTKQFLQAHYGVVPQGMEDILPAILGRYDIPVSEWEVFNQAETTDSAPLGSRAAMGTFGDKCKEFSYKSSEHCVVMGLIWFSVDNNMTDSLNKSWYVLDRTEIPDPLFANNGVIAVRHKEVAPLLATDGEDIWGYQRQYGWMIEEHDTLAGDYCTPARANEIMVRQLSSMPTLGHDFKTLDPSTLTNIFTGEVNGDVIHGQIWFDVTLTTWLAQRPNVIVT